MENDQAKEVAQTLAGAGMIKNGEPIRGPFILVIETRETPPLTEEEKSQVEQVVKEFHETVDIENPDNSMPACINSITIKRS